MIFFQKSLLWNGWILRRFFSEKSKIYFKWMNLPTNFFRKIHFQMDESSDNFFWNFDWWNQIKRMNFPTNYDFFSEKFTLKWMNSPTTFSEKLTFQMDEFSDNFFRKTHFQMNESSNNFFWKNSFQMDEFSDNFFWKKQIKILWYDFFSLIQKGAGPINKTKKLKTKIVKKTENSSILIFWRRCFFVFSLFYKWKMAKQKVRRIHPFLFCNFIIEKQKKKKKRSSENSSIFILLFRTFNFVKQNVRRIHPFPFCTFVISFLSISVCKKWIVAMKWTIWLHSFAHLFEKEQKNDAFF